MAFMPQASRGDRLLATLLWLSPTRAISRCAHILARSRRDWLRRALIRLFLRAYSRIDMHEAAEPDPGRYVSFEAFFTRALAADRRPMPADPALAVSPVDGTLGAYGTIQRGQLCQTKGVAYALADLVGHDGGWADRFMGGRYATFYLAPHDYHRVHMPLTGRLCQSDYRPGRLFGVNPRCVRAIPRLFCRNERLVAFYATAAGPIAMVLVGAFIVGAIHTRWAGRVCPPHRRMPGQQHFGDGAGVQLQRGEEMGYFSMGSSVILLGAAGALSWLAELRTGQALRLGQPIAVTGVTTRTA